MLGQRRTAILILVGVAAIVGLGAAVLVAADRGDGQSGQTVSDAQGLRSCAETRKTQVPQPTAALLEAAGLDELQLAPTRDRVDLVAPPFSNATKVTNPLFPIAKLDSAILNGQVDGKPFKVETRLLPQTR